MIVINIDDQHVTDVLRELQRRLDDMQAAMQEVGETLAASTKARFVTSTAPDGTPWARNSQVTYLRMIEGRAGTTLKKGANAGRVNAKGAALAVGKRPLIGETHRLSTEIAARASRDSVSIGSSLVYAATQQFGAAKGAFGTDSRRHPIPWGTIPARPFMGLSNADGDAVLAIVGAFLKGAFNA